MNSVDFLTALNLKKIFTDFNTSSNYSKYLLLERNVTDTYCQLLLQNMSNSNWRPTNHVHVFAELNIVNSDILHFSRNILSSDGKEFLGDYLRDMVDEKLPKTIEINNVKYSQKQFGFDYFYFNDNFVEEEYVNLNDTMKVVKLKCTEIGGIFVPSKRASRFFMVSEGTVYNEGVVSAVHYNTHKNPSIWTLPVNDIMILGSLKKLHKMKRTSNDLMTIDQIRQLYGEKMTNKLLKLE